MCGIAGMVDPAGARDGELGRLAESMASALAHRGPDDSGVWEDASAGVALAHRRLEVVGRGAQGRQPMQAGAWVLNYNGELYNTAELSSALASAGAAPRGSSDTEALALSLETWGLDETLRRIEGMFAFAAWDRRSRALHLVRDRFGEKPLFYGWVGRRFVFASELKAVHTIAGFRPGIDPAAVAAFLQFSCVPAPQCIYEGFAKLRPGSLTTLTGDCSPGRLPEQHVYWSAEAAIADAGRLAPLVDDREAEETVDAALSGAVAARMVADVPVGALLSGGIDSSLIVALMQRHSRRPVRTFTVAFAEQSFDESASAAAVARHLGTDHTTIEMPAREVLDLVPKLPEIWDEPFSDSSQLPTHLVAEVARRSVTVALSGDGGDELFAGYNRHAWLDRVWRWATPVPQGLRRRVGAAACLVPPGVVDTTAGLLPKRWQVRMPSTKVVKLGRVLQASSVQEAYRSLTAHWERPAELVPGVRTRPGTGALDNARLPAWDGEGDVTAQLLKADLVSYLPDDVLTKVDRASMAVSLETRAPFLDRGVLEAAWRLPTSTKVRDGTSKWVLRRILYRHVPPELVDRPKMGFGVPLADWLRGPLRPWAEDLLSPDALTRHGLLDPAPVRRAWKLHTDGRQDLGYELWDVLMLQAWLDRWNPTGID
jgi:asparagine synthase (glutamine-hydrolysing)